jgi:hypothetical protein
MRLRDLDGRFLKYIDDRNREYVEDIKDADGIMFQCPLCAQKCETGELDGRRFYVGAHYIVCWFVGKVPPDLNPLPGRWNPSGTSIDDLTFVPPGAVSILLTGGCNWHGFIVNGDAS